ncbi:MAG: RING-HC finger protein [Bacteroidetes bacterium]|nr:RING-HC finger protein [Bacteroidota bacterium]
MSYTGTNPPYSGTTYSHSGTTYSHSGPTHSYSGTTAAIQYAQEYPLGGYVSNSPPLGGMAGPAAYAPADFLDAQELQPLGVTFDVGGHGSTIPYTTAVNAMIHKQTDEIKGRCAALLNMPSGWKKRLRDFLSVKNNELLDFMKLSVPSHSVLGPGEVLLRRFGNPQVVPNHASVRDMVMDISGGVETTILELNEQLDHFKADGNLTNYANQTRVIFESYKEAGDEVLKQQNLLRTKLDKLDRVQTRISGFLEIDANDTYGALMESVENYLKKIYEDNKIEEDYMNLIKAYRRFATLRDVVTMSRSILSYESEPLCSICLAETVAFVITPCGHTICQTCMRRQTNQCFFCRGPIRDKIKMYFT